MRHHATSRLVHHLVALFLLTTVMFSCVADQAFDREDIDTEVAQFNEVVGAVEEIYCRC